MIRARIRPWAPDDADRCVQVAIDAQVPVFASMLEIYGDDLFARLRPGWKAGQRTAVEAWIADAEAAGWVAEVGDGIVGFVATTADPATGMGSVEMIAVHPDQQRRGVGSQLLSRALDQQRSVGVVYVQAFIRDFPGHEAALRTLRAGGFVRHAVQPTLLFATLDGAGQPAHPPAGVRRIEEADVDRCVHFGLNAFRSVYASFEHLYGPELFSRIEPDWERSQATYIRTAVSDPDDETWVYEIDGRVAGFVVLKLDEHGIADIDLLAVDQALQNNGVATTLNGLALDRAQEASMRYVIVATADDPGHAPARRSYAACRLHADADPVEPAHRPAVASSRELGLDVTRAQCRCCRESPSRPCGVSLRARVAGCSRARGRRRLVDQQRDHRGRVEVGDHRRCSTTRSPTRPTGRRRSATDHRRSKLFHSRGTCRSIGRLVHPTRQSNRSIGVGEDVDSVHEDAWRAMESDPLGVLRCADEIARDGHVGQVAETRGESVVGHLPVRAVGEVEQCHIHDRTLNPDLHIKVNRYDRVMLIGELADQLALPPETVRFYEQRGLLPEPQRATNGYRMYSDTALHRLRFIRTAQAAGLTLAEIRSIIDLRDEGTVPCSHVGALLETKLAEVQQRQRDLAALEIELDLLLQRSRSLDPADCGDDDVCHILAARTGAPVQADADDPAVERSLDARVVDRTFCDPDGSPRNGAHVGIQVRSEPEGLVAGDEPSARWDIEV